MVMQGPLFNGDVPGKTQVRCIEDLKPMKKP